jgi:hypothetical protein
VQEGRHCTAHDRRILAESRGRCGRVPGQMWPRRVADCARINQRLRRLVGKLLLWTKGLLRETGLSADFIDAQRLPREEFPPDELTLPAELPPHAVRRQWPAA